MQNIDEGKKTIDSCLFINTNRHVQPLLKRDPSFFIDKTNKKYLFLGTCHRGENVIYTFLSDEARKILYKLFGKVEKRKHCKILIEKKKHN